MYILRNSSENFVRSTYQQDNFNKLNKHTGGIYYNHSLSNVCVFLTEAELDKVDKAAKFLPSAPPYSLILGAEKFGM